MNFWSKLRPFLHDVMVPLILAILTHQTFVSKPEAFTVPPVPFAPKVQKVNDPMAATVLLKAGKHECTATILSIRPGPGEYYALSAGHCVSGGIREGTLSLKDNRAFSFRVERTLAGCDLALLRFRGPEGLPTASIARETPGADTAVWHCGHGTDRPGLQTPGTLTKNYTRDGRFVFRMAVIPGDSGAGIFRSDTGELVSVVSARSPGLTYGSMTRYVWQIVQVPNGGNCPPGGCPVN